MGDLNKHFVLVHGACHGAWCWYKLVTLLKQLGHRVTALDLGACGVNPKQLMELISIWDYMQPLMEFMSSLPQGESVILVGHSYAGLCISIAMESFPEKISVAAFLTAYMPNLESPPGTLIQEVKKKKKATHFLIYHCIALRKDIFFMCFTFYLLFGIWKPVLQKEPCRILIGLPVFRGISKLWPGLYEDQAVLPLPIRGKIFEQIHPFN
jgi:pimeloyl-ACP methyl ester carboxylesterase